MVLLLVRRKQKNKFLVVCNPSQKKRYKPRFFCSALLTFTRINKPLR